MALLVNCECGERVAGDDSDAGKEIPCPACGKPVAMPQAYNPLSTAKYLQTSAAPAAEEAPPPVGMPCSSCAGTGNCPHCNGGGQAIEPFLERVTNGINRVVVGIFSTLGELLGANPLEGRRPTTRSEKRRATACQACDGKGKCFRCEGSGNVIE